MLATQGQAPATYRIAPRMCSLATNKRPTVLEAAGIIGNGTAKRVAHVGPSDEITVVSELATTHRGEGAEGRWVIGWVCAIRHKTRTTAADGAAN